MKNCLIFIAILTSINVISAQVISDSSNSTYALVIGISDYQDEAIPDLNYAHKDAEFFSSYLQSKVGGNLSNQNIKLLTNKQAKAGNIVSSFDWIIEKCRKGDRAIIYFSGHGDVERVTRFQRGYLLAYDALATTYMAGGTFEVRVIQDIVSTLSEAGVEVIMISDACRAGKLAGSEYGGTQATASALSIKFANEIKILSCQPDEFSLEGEQWGSGRGCFSYHLIDGLLGLADENNDYEVTLLEIENYLEKIVPRETDPQVQIPMTIGNPKTPLSFVNENALDSLKITKSRELLSFTKSENKRLTESTLLVKDSTVQELFDEFMAAIARGDLMKPEGKSADDYYTTLIEEQKIAHLHSQLKRDYAAALQNEAQTVLNSWLKTDLEEIVLSKKMQSLKYNPYPNYLKRAAEILGEDHYMFSTIKARENFFKGYLLYLSNPDNPDDELGYNVLKYYKESLEWQPDMSHVYLSMSNVYAYNLLNQDSARYYAQKASKNSPAWVLPYTHLAFSLSNRFNNLNEAFSLLESALNIDSSSVLIYNGLGIEYYNQANYILAEKMFLKGIHLDSNFVNSYTNLGNFYALTEQYEKAKYFILKAAEKDTTNSFTYNSLGCIYFKNRKFVEAEAAFSKAIYLDSFYLPAYYNLGEVYSRIAHSKIDSSDIDKRKYYGAKAIKMFIKVLELDSSSIILISPRMLGLSDPDEFEKFYNTYKSLLINISNEDNNRFQSFFDPTKWNAFGRVSVYTQNEKNYKKAIKNSPKFIAGYNRLGYTYIEMHRYIDAEIVLQKALEIDSFNRVTLYGLGELYYKTNQFKKAEFMYMKAIEIDQNFGMAYFEIACFYSQIQESKLAFEYLELAILKGVDKYEEFQTYSGLANIRNLPEWKDLMKKYFPNKSKG